MKPREFFARMLDTYAQHQKRKLAASWYYQNRDERRFRLDAVVALSVEYDKAIAFSRASSVFGRNAVEAVIEGDWKEAEACCEYLRFNDEPGGEKLARIWDSFVTKLQTVCAEARRREYDDSYHRKAN